MILKMNQFWQLINITEIKSQLTNQNYNFINERRLILK